MEGVALLFFIVMLLMVLSTRAPATSGQAEFTALNGRNSRDQRFSQFSE
jgi:hypothetical protein